MAEKQNTTYFHYYNANPKGKITDDCVYRAVSAFLDISWEDVAKLESDFYLKTGRTFQSMDTPLYHEESGYWNSVVCEYLVNNFNCEYCHRSFHRYSRSEIDEHLKHFNMPSEFAFHMDFGRGDGYGYYLVNIPRLEVFIDKVAEPGKSYLVCTPSHVTVIKDKKIFDTFDQSKHCPSFILSH